ncbi:MAG TPA: ArsA family ATPase [Thermoleophilaceae bacterium]|nr:ArsA family ATPase [Thermoleophilaceae bacterium]
MATDPAIDILDKRLLFVMGKGGVGRSTVALAIGLLAARRGRRVIICEVAQQKRMSRVFRRQGVGSEETELVPGLSAISIEPQRAMEEYLRHQVGNRALFRLLFENRIFQYLAAAAPGVRELVTMGKIWELAQLERPWTARSTRYDLVVVDSPATGHGLGILRVARTMREVARVGPIRRQADRIDRFVHDRRQTGIVAVSLPEEMPVTETLEFRERLAGELDMEVDAVVVNGVHPERFSADDARALAETQTRSAAEVGDGEPDSPAHAAIRAALAEHGRSRAQRSQVQRLRRGVGGGVTLPYLFAPELDLEAVEGLSRELERRLSRAGRQSAAGTGRSGAARTKQP